MKHFVCEPQRQQQIILMPCGEKLFMLAILAPFCGCCYSEEMKRYQFRRNRVEHQDPRSVDLPTVRANVVFTHVPCQNRKRLKWETLCTLTYVSSLSQGRYADAEPLLALAVTIREDDVGNDHPDFAMVLNNMGELLQAMARKTSSCSVFDDYLGGQQKLRTSRLPAGWHPRSTTPHALGMFHLSRNAPSCVRIQVMEQEPPLPPLP